MVVEGGPEWGGGSVADRLRWLRNEQDWLRCATVLEPRGWEGLVGAWLCEPHEPDCTAGVIFFNNVGYLGMCGHGVIGLMTSLAHLGMLEPGAHRLDTPVGVVQARLNDNGTVTVENVPSSRFQTQVEVRVPGYGVVTGDIAWGGNWFFIVNHSPLPVTRANVPMLLTFARAVRHALDEQEVTGADGATIDHIEVCAPAPPGLAADGVNFVLCPGGAYDRSPCGTGTSAKLACLHEDGVLKEGQTWRQAGILGTVFEGRVVRCGSEVIPEITGRAWVTGEARLLLAPDDPFRQGIV